MSVEPVRSAALDTALDRFFVHYYWRRPVNATFTGMHAHDSQLPDWSETGLSHLTAEMRGLLSELQAASVRPGPVVPEATRNWRRRREQPQSLDAMLAQDFLALQIAENDSRHGPRGNPSLWSGEAVFAVIALMIRPFATLSERMAAAVARMQAIPAFLRDAEMVMADAPIPDAWRVRALRDCDGAAKLFTSGIDAWTREPECGPQTDAVRAASAIAIAAFARFAEWLRGRAAGADAYLSCGPAMYDLLLSRGHHCERTRESLLAEARLVLREASARLHAMAAERAGSWPDAQQQMADAHPSPEGYLAAFADTWDRVRQHAALHDVVTWPEWPIRYVPFPACTRDAAPLLYYLFYRSPAPLDPYVVYDYVVPPLPHDPAAAEQHLRAWNQSVITLNHVVHHGSIGHHIQNWHAYHRASSRIGQIAAVDCANRVGMFCAGTMAEGWACYATGLMDELGFLTPLEQLSEQHSRVRFLGRAIVDIELHQGTMSFAEAIAFYQQEIGLGAEMARAETVKNSMFPGTAIMYWLGTQAILDLRRRMRQQQGDAFSLKQFHDTLLGFGSIPIPLIARLMSAGTD